MISWKVKKSYWNCLTEGYRGEAQVERNCYLVEL